MWHRVPPAASLVRACQSRLRYDDAHLGGRPSASTVPSCVCSVFDLDTAEVTGDDPRMVIYDVIRGGGWFLRTLEDGSAVEPSHVMIGQRQPEGP